jgi:hypothetical protein
MQVMIEDYVHEHANKFAALPRSTSPPSPGPPSACCVIRLALGGA